MKSSIGLTWTFGLIVGFILLFSSFITLSLNYTTAFRVKNEALGIIEKYEGYTSNSKTVIDNYLSSSGYKTKGKCPDGYTGVESYGENEEIAASNKQYYYCISRDVSTSVYTLILFYRFNLPILGDIMVFEIRGVSNQIKKLPETGLLA